MSVIEALPQDQGRDVAHLLPVFRASASDDAFRLAQLLSVALALPADEIPAAALAAGWDIEVRPALDELLSWPFVVAGRDGFRVHDVIANSLILDLATDYERLFRIHEFFVERERRRELEADDDEVWFVRGRIAYYLAGLAPAESIGNFIDRFTDAPIVDRTAARVWLSTLVAHQQPFLAAHTRELAFFQGFRAYVAGDRSAAMPLLSSVVGEAPLTTVSALEHPDRFTAIAAHLVGTMLRRKSPAVAARYLELAIELSEALGLEDNEVMARQTLVWSHVERGQRSEAPRATRRYIDAHELASLNARRARSFKDEYLVDWTEQTAAETEWIVLTRNHEESGRGHQATADRLIRLLERKIPRHVRRGDLESAGLAGNAAATIAIDARQFSKALGLVERALEATEWSLQPLGAFVRLRKTTARLLGQQRVGEEDRARAHRLLEQLDDKIGSTGARRVVVRAAPEESPTLPIERGEEE